MGEVFKHISNKCASPIFLPLCFPLPTTFCLEKRKHDNKDKQVGKRRKKKGGA